MDLFHLFVLGYHSSSWQLLDIFLSSFLTAPSHNVLFWVMEFKFKSYGWHRLCIHHTVTGSPIFISNCFASILRSLLLYVHILHFPFSTESKLLLHIKSWHTIITQTSHLPDCSGILAFPDTETNLIITPPPYFLQFPLYHYSMCPDLSMCLSN